MSIRPLSPFMGIRVLPRYEVELTDDWRSFRLGLLEWLRLEEILNDLRVALPPDELAAALRSVHAAERAATPRDDNDSA